MSGLSLLSLVFTALGCNALPHGLLTLGCLFLPLEGVEGGVEVVPGDVLALSALSESLVVLC